jgi:hypothetical protein
MKAKMNPALWRIDSHTAGGKTFTHHEPVEVTQAEFDEIAKKQYDGHAVIVLVEDKPKGEDKPPANKPVVPNP